MVPGNSEEATGARFPYVVSVCIGVLVHLRDCDSICSNSDAVADAERDEARQCRGASRRVIECTRTERWQASLPELRLPR